jgi:hypothetical protein
MKKLVILTAALISNAVWAEIPATNASQATPDPDQTICRTVAVTGSRLSHNRICMTRAQWADQRRENRETIEQSQANARPH